MEKDKKVSDLTVKQFEELSLGLKSNHLKTFFKEVTDDFREDLKTLIQEDFDARGLGDKEKTREFIYALKRMVKTGNTFKNSFISQFGTILASNLVLLATGYFTGVIGG